MEKPGISRRRFLQYAAASSLSPGLSGLTVPRDCLAQPAESADFVRGAAAGRRLAGGQPSATAYGTAMQRAAHQIFDDPRIFEDPFALRIIGADREALLWSNPERYQTRRSLAVRAFVVMRSRYAEDALAQAIRRGVRQYVILGAGLDTFAYRNPYPDRVRVMEVDHPSTQAWKRERLRESGIRIPGSLIFAPIDFETQTLEDGLKRAGFRSGEPAFFSWLGVVVYLTEAAVMQTLRFVASSAAPDSEIVFDFLLPSASLSEQQKRGREASIKRVAALGEPWVSFFEPPALAGVLERMGFAGVEVFGPDDANQRYFQDRIDDLYVRGTNHLIRARV
jgi:methyltransferase (TIGR00027 family)